MKSLNYILGGALALSLLTACGGGGGGGSTAPTYSGLTTPVAITQTNAQNLSTKSTDATQEAITQDAASDANPFGAVVTSSSGINPLIVDITRQAANAIQAMPQLPTGATINVTDFGPPFCGGSITYPDNFGSNGTLNGTITYNNVCYSDSYLGQITINGTVQFSETASEITIRYINFSVTGGGLSETINMTISCDTSFLSCSISADFEGSDGKVYRIADMTVTGSGTGPYSISATFYHPDYGYVTISGNGLTYNCSNGYPDAGTINITGANGSSASITFAGCAGYSGTWNDGISSGTFSGSWL